MDFIDDTSSIRIDYCKNGLSDNAISIDSVTEHDCIIIPQQLQNNNSSTDNIVVYQMEEN